MTDTDINATISTGVAIAVGFDGTSIGDVVFAGTNAIDVSIEGSSGISVTLGFGVDGSSGTSGSAGSHGTSGSSGSNGSSGSSGSSGTDGSHGTSGSSGTSGESGSAGSSGESGSHGTSGTSGSSGTSGVDGTSGEDGSSGTSGSSGSSGTSGEAGSSGTSGIDGSHGTSGSSGTSGTDGSSGTSGEAGSSGTSGTSSSLGNIAAQSVLGNPTGSPAVASAITVAEQTLVGRITGGNVDDLSVAQVKTLIGNASESDVGFAELATSTEAIAGTDALRVVTPAGNAASEAVIKNPLQISQGISMVYASGATGIAVADNDNIDLGTGDFTLVWRGSLPDWTPSIIATCLYKNASGYGYGLSVNTDGTMLIKLYRNAPSGTEYRSTVAPSLLSRTTHEIAAVVTRETAVADGSIVFYIDGVQLGASVAITAESPVTLNNAAPLYISGAAASRPATVANFAAIFRRALTSDELISLYRTGLYDGDKWGSVTPLYSSDFSVNEDGWLKANMGTLAGNIDGIAGEDDWLRGYADNIANIHRMYRVITGFNGRAYYQVNFKYYIPATNTNCNGIKLIHAGMTSVAYGTLYNTTGSVVEASEIYYTDNDTRIGLQFTLVKNGGAFTGVGADTDDLVYIKDFTVTNLGAVIALEPEGIQPAPGQWLDSSSNKLHAMQPATGSSLIRSKKEFEIRWTNTWAGTHEAQYVGGLNRAILPPNCYIQSYVYVIAGATIEDVIIGDGSDTGRWVTVTTGLAAGTGEFTLANQISDGTNYKIVIDPDANFTGSITSLIKGVILE